MSREIVITAVELGWIVSCTDAHSQGSIIRQFAAETTARVIQLIEELIESRAIETEREKGGIIP